MLFDMPFTQLSAKEQRMCYRNPREFHMLTEELARILGKFKMLLQPALPTHVYCILVFGPCIFIIEEKNKPTKCTN